MTWEHVCGLQGFGRGREGLNDICPACEMQKNGGGGIGRSSPLKIVSMHMSQDMHELIKKVAKVRNIPRAKVIQSILEDQRQKLQDEVDSNIEFPENSIGHLMSKFRKGCE